MSKDPNREYYYAANKGRMNGGIFKIDDGMGDVPPHWLPYFTVADVKACIATAEDKGGHTDGSMGMAGLGDFAIITDPTGATVAIIQLSSEPDKWVE